jgi:type VI secretion system secreted protein VgrG
VRVSQLWAGKTWGGIHIPRIGQEVLVSFLEGDPDQPMITGRVYNAENMPPYTLPDNKTQSGIKSKSSKGGGKDHFNELRFEDLKDKEEIYLHAEKDLTTVVENHESRLTYNTRKAVIGSEDNHRPSESIEETLVHGMRLINIRGNDGLIVKEGDKGRKVQVQDGSYELEVQKENYLLGVKMGDASIETKMGKVTIKAMTSIELIVGTSSVKIDPTGVTIKGTLLNSEAKAVNVVKGALVQIN